MTYRVKFFPNGEVSDCVALVSRHERWWHRYPEVRSWSDGMSGAILQATSAEEAISEARRLTRG